MKTFLFFFYLALLSTILCQKEDLAPIEQIEATLSPEDRIFQAEESQFDQQDKITSDTLVYHDDEFDVKPKYNNYEEDAFLSEWEKQMADYEPEFIYQIPIESLGVLEFYQEIKVESDSIKGAFLVPDLKDGEFYFQIQNEKSEKLFESTKKGQIFQLEGKKNQLLRIIFTNKTEEDLIITFTMNTHYNTLVKKHEVTEVDEKMNELVTLINRLNLEMKIKRNTQDERSRSS